MHHCCSLTIERFDGKPSYGLQRRMTAGFINSVTAPTEVESIIRGLCQLIFISQRCCPAKKMEETSSFSGLQNIFHWFCSRRSSLRENVVLKYTMYVHPNRGEKFWKKFSRLREVRSLLPKEVNIMALTATATNKTHQVVMSFLGMEESTKVVSICPDKPNIVTCTLCQNLLHLIKCWEAFANSLKLKCGWMIIFCPKIHDCSDIYLYSKKDLSDSFLYPMDAPDMCEYRLVEVLHSVLDESHKQKILSAFTCSDPASPLGLSLQPLLLGWELITLTLTKLFIIDHHMTWICTSKRQVRLVMMVDSVMHLSCHVKFNMLILTCWLTSI